MLTLKSGHKPELISLPGLIVGGTERKIFDDEDLTLNKERCVSK